MDDDRFKSLNGERVIRNKRGRQWVDVPKEVRESDSESEAESEQIEGLSEDSEEAYESDQDSNDLDFLNLIKDSNTTEVSTKRLAVLHFDFEEYTLEYLSFLIKSAMNIDGKLKSITKYPTEEYMQRIEDDIKFGPKEFRIQDFDGKETESNDICNSEELNEANKNYAISRLKFFIVVFEFDSVETSDLIYTSLDGVSLEDSGLKLDLRYVPDDKQFEIPDQYMHLVQSMKPNCAKFKATNSKPSCFGQTKCNRTWDETPHLKQSFCDKAFDQSDCDLSDVEDFCGGATESEYSASDNESEFYTTVDGPTIPKYRKKRIPVDELRSIYGLPPVNNDSSDEEYEEEDEDEKIEEIISDEDGSVNDYVVDETVNDEDSNSSNEDKVKQSKDLSAMKKKKIKIKEKSKMMIKENALKREKKKASVREYLKECAENDDRFDEFLTDPSFKVSQTHNKYEDAKEFLIMMAIRAKKLNIVPSFSLVDEDEDASSKPPNKKRKFNK